VAKAPIYREEDASTMTREITELRLICGELKEYAPPELYDQLMAAVDAVEEATRANTPIFRGSHRVGYGVKKAQKDLACDKAMVILKAIKAGKGW
jgi:hypothetical protein